MTLLDTEDRLAFACFCTLHNRTLSKQMPWGKLGENGVREGFVITLRKYPRVMTSCPVGSKKAERRKGGSLSHVS